MATCTPSPTPSMNTRLFYASSPADDSEVLVPCGRPASPASDVTTHSLVNSQSPSPAADDTDNEETQDTKDKHEKPVWGQAHNRHPRQRHHRKAEDPKVDLSNLLNPAIGRARDH